MSPNRGFTEEDKVTGHVNGGVVQEILRRRQQLTPDPTLTGTEPAVQVGVPSRETTGPLYQSYLNDQNPRPNETCVQIGDVFSW